MDTNEPENGHKMKPSITERKQHAHYWLLNTIVRLFYCKYTLVYRDTIGYFPRIAFMNSWPQLSTNAKLYGLPTPVVVWPTKHRFYQFRCLNTSLIRVSCVWKMCCNGSGEWEMYGIYLISAMHFLVYTSIDQSKVIMICMLHGTAMIYIIAICRVSLTMCL